MLEQSPSLNQAVVATTSKPIGIKPSSDELECLYKKLSEVGKPVLLSFVPGYCEAYVPLYEQGILPKPLANFYQEEYLDLTYPDLLLQCEAFCSTMKISEEEARSI